MGRIRYMCPKCGQGGADEEDRYPYPLCHSCDGRMKPVLSWCWPYC
jgi:hypothetical protein